MTKRFNLLSLSAALCAVLAATAAYALSSTTKRATVPIHATVSTSVPASSNTVSLASKSDSDGEENDDKNDTPDPTSAKLTPAQAAAAALAAYPGGAVTGTPALEDEDGVTVYEVHITADGKKYDVKVDANTGKVLKSEADDNDGEDEDDGPSDGPDGGGHNGQEGK